MTMIVSAPIMLVGEVVISLEQNVKLSGVIVATIPIVALVVVIFLLKATPYFKIFQKVTNRLNERSCASKFQVQEWCGRS